MNSNGNKCLYDELFFHALFRESRGKIGRKADLRGADLRKADLRGADLREANIVGAKLSESICRMDFGSYSVCIREEETSIGCKTKNNGFWLSAESRDIFSLAPDAKKFWVKYGDMIKAAIKAFIDPNQPNGERNE